MSDLSIDVSKLSSGDRIFNLEIMNRGELEKHATMAAFRALNKTARWLRTQATREVSQKTAIQQKLIRERLRLLRASRRNLQARIFSDKHYIRASDLGRVKQTAKGARAGKHFFEGAFVATMNSSSGRQSIYRRKGKERFPVREMGYYFRSHYLSALEDGLLDREIGERFDRFFEHELNFILSKA